MTDLNPTEAAVEKAGLAVFAREQEVVARTHREALEAVVLVATYAEHLAAGGEPWKYPEPKPAEGESRWTLQSRHVPFKLGLEIVFEEWNEARGERANPFSAVGYSTKYRIAEYALDNLGVPLVYDRLARIGPSSTRMKSADVAQILAELQDTNGRDLVLRRARIDGKIAYLLRPRADGETYVGVRGDHGRLSKIDSVGIPLEKKAAVA